MAGSSIVFFISQNAVHISCVTTCVVPPYNSHVTFGAVYKATKILMDLCINLKGLQNQKYYSRPAAT